MVLFSIINIQKSRFPEKECLSIMLLESKRYLDYEQKINFSYF